MPMSRTEGPRHCLLEPPSELFDFKPLVARASVISVSVLGVDEAE